MAEVSIANPPPTFLIIPWYQFPDAQEGVLHNQPGNIPMLLVLRHEIDRDGTP